MMESSKKHSSQSRRHSVDEPTTRKKIKSEYGESSGALEEDDRQSKEDTQRSPVSASADIVKVAHNKKDRDVKKAAKKRRCHSSSSSKSSHDSTTSGSEDYSKRHSKSSHKKSKKKHKSKKKKKKSNKSKDKKKGKVHDTESKTLKNITELLVQDPDEFIGPRPEKMCTSNMKPMTKEEWEKQQSVIKRVYDPETGRHRLIKGDGEVLEEIVSYQKHKDINKMATAGDGASFQSKLGLNKQ